MKKTILLFLSTCLAFSLSWAADSTSVLGQWKTVLEANLAAAQSSYSDNWIGGQAGSVNWVANLHAVASKQVSTLIRTENELKMQFGQTHNQVDSTNQWLSPVKSSDRIRFDTVEKFSVRAWVNPYVAGYIETEFYDGTVPAAKQYLSPLELSESAGISKDLIKTDGTKLNSRTGFALRQITRKTATPGVSPGSYVVTTTRQNDGGIEWVTDFVQTLRKNLNYTTKLTVYKALFIGNNPLAGTAGEDYWKTPNLNWDNILTANVTKAVQVSLAWQLLYDKPINLAGRFRQTLSLGLGWQL